MLALALTLTAGHALAGGPGPEAQALYEQGLRHQTGQGAPLDRARALQLFGAAAAQGHAAASHALSRHHRGLDGGTVDPQQARVHAERAARLGHVPAQLELGFAHFNGSDGIAKDLAVAHRWFSAAAAQGSVAAQCMLGDFYKSGLGGVRQDAAKALHWYRRTAVTEHPCALKSQFELYQAYASGQGVRRDLRQAMDWLQKSAEGGNPRAQQALSRAYRDGRGVERDAAMEKRWWRLSREGVAPHDDHEHELPSFAGPLLSQKLAPLQR